MSKRTYTGRDYCPKCNAILGEGVGLEYGRCAGCIVDERDDLLAACKALLQAFDPTYPGACHQECFDTADGHGYELREAALEKGKAAIAKAERSDNAPTPST